MTTETNDWRSVVRAWQRRGFDLVVEGRTVIMRRVDKAAIELMSVSEFGGAGFSEHEREALADELKQFIDGVTATAVTNDMTVRGKKP